jgi:hypothetical protein
MATYYANLDLTGTGGDGLTELTPWFADSFRNNVDLTPTLSAGDIVKLKGQHDYGGVNFNIRGMGGSGITLENWEASPWRIKTNNTFNINPYSGAENGIIETIHFQLSDITIVNCFVKSTYLNPYTSSGTLINGCTLIASVINDSACPSYVIDIKDSIIDISTFNNFDAVSSENCCYTIATIPGIGVHTNYQVNWTPPLLACLGCNTECF